MGDLIRNGGPPVWVILLFGIIVLVDAILIVRRPDERKLAFLRAMSLAQVFAMVAGFTAGVAKSILGCRGLPPAMKDKWPFFVAQGTAESLADIILGSAFLALAWFIAAMGVRRQMSQ